MSDFKNGVPPITAPWPKADVRANETPYLASVTMTDLVIDHLCFHHGYGDDSGLPRMVLVAGSLLILPGKSVSEGGALDHSIISCDDDDLVHSTQSHILTYHDCHTTFTLSDHTVLPRENGVGPAVVRFLVIRWPSDYPVVVLCLSIGNEFARSDETNQDGAG